MNILSIVVIVLAFVNAILNIVLVYLVDDKVIRTLDAIAALLWAAAGTFKILSLVL